MNATPQLDELSNTIAKAYSESASTYDIPDEEYPNLARMRQKVYAHVLRSIPPRSRILEINAGTGTDAVYLAKQGYTIHATDISVGMLAKLVEKVWDDKLDGSVTSQVCSFYDLDKTTGWPFDAVFSNIGGLNCAKDLSPIIEKLPLVLRPGGVLVWVIMPPFCMWVFARIFMGGARYGLGRMLPSGTTAHLAGYEWPMTYYTPEQVVRALGPNFKVMAIEGLSVFTPPAISKNLALKYPKAYDVLAKIDDVLAPRWPFRAWGDFFILSARYQPTTITHG